MPHSLDRRHINKTRQIPTFSFYLRMNGDDDEMEFQTDNQTNCSILKPTIKKYSHFRLIKKEFRLIEIKLEHEQPFKKSIDSRQHMFTITCKTCKTYLNILNILISHSHLLDSIYIWKCSVRFSFQSVCAFELNSLVFSVEMCRCCWLHARPC